ncbi:MAG: MerR family transcriptional regulator [Propionibacteriaceae bacterium]|jgi:DNA-binding transcriptional MerR regulator|nr:MerR family transcriptional regulator [Propionibacteriaceae bacterium]
MNDAGDFSQEALFEGDFSAVGEDVGYRGPVACAAVGITYRQLDYWARTGLVVPQIRIAEGSGTQRLYSFRDLLFLKVIKRLIDTGISLQQIRLAISHLRSRGQIDITAITLVSDGTSVFECTQDDEIIDLVKGGQAMFAIDLAGVWHDIEGTLVELPTNRADEVWIDELSQRRQARRTA